MLLSKNASQFFIMGPVGQLDCLELKPNHQEVNGFAIIFHPDPKGGGTYTNKIVQTLAKVLNNKGYICYCPNLRGVGLSDGEHDFGNGEVEDGIAVYNYVKNKFPDLSAILGGFSFGTKIASSLAQRLDYNKLILVGPAVTRYEVKINNPEKSVVIHGDEDEVISLDAVLKWSREENQPVLVVPNSGHFFHGKLIILQNLLTQLIQ